jgi:UTP--glucose-1-phosphate uridylyltransferase
MIIHKVVIPAAGLGSRLYPLTKSQPKEMLPLGRRPAIQLVVEEALDAGLDGVLMITGQHKRAIEDHFDIGNGNGFAKKAPYDLPAKLLKGTAHVFYVRQPAPLGLGDAVLRAAPFVDKEPFLVSLGDAVIHATAAGPSIVERMIQAFDEKRPEAVIAVRQVSPANLSSYGVVAPINGSDGPIFQVKDIVEKPQPSEAPSSYAVTGRYIFSPLIFEYIRQTAPDDKGEVQLTDAIRSLIRDNHSVWVVKLDSPRETRYDVGNFLQYAEAFLAFALQDEDDGPALADRYRRCMPDA